MDTRTIRLPEAKVEPHAEIFLVAPSPSSSGKTPASAPGMAHPPAPKLLRVVIEKLRGVLGFQPKEVVVIQQEFILEGSEGTRKRPVKKF